MTKTTKMLAVAGVAGALLALTAGSAAAEKKEFLDLTATSPIITVGDDAEIDIVVTKEKTGRDKFDIEFMLGDGCDGATVDPAGPQEIDFDAGDEVTVTFTVSGLAVGTCEFTVVATQGPSDQPFNDEVSGTIEVRPTVIVGSDSDRMILLGLMLLGVGSLIVAGTRRTSHI